MTIQFKQILPTLLFFFILPFLLPTPPVDAETIYTVNNNATVSVIDTTNESLTNTISLPFGSKPNAICLNSVSPHAYTLNSSDNTISIIETTKKILVSTITDARFTGLTTIACDPTGTSLLIGNNDTSGVVSSILYLNTATLKLDSLETAVGNNPASIVFNKNGSKAYVLNRGTPSISVINTSTKLVNSTTPLLDSDAPYALAMHSQGTYLYVVNFVGSSVTFINPDTMGIVPTPLSVGIFPTALAVSNATNTLYVPDAFGTISLVDPGSQSVTSSFTCESPIALTELNNGKKVYVASMSDDTIRAYDTNSLFTPPATISLPPFSSPQGLATLQGVRHNLDLTITGNGSGSVNWPFNVAFPQETSGTVGVPEGIAVTINAAADSCSTAVWNVCDSPSGGGTNSIYCSVNPFTAGKSVSAIFTKKVEHTISTSVTGVGGAIACPTSVCDGGSATCTITPAVGYELSSLKDNVTDILGNVTGGTTFQLHNVVAPRSIAAEFTLTKFTVSASSDDINKGSITPTSQTVSYGNTASFSLSPMSGSIVSVAGCGGSHNGGIYTTGPITGNCSVSAIFSEKTYSITSRVQSGGGTISCTPTIVMSGQSSTCTITPNSGYHLEILNDGLDVTSSVTGNSYQIAGITSSHDLVALFINSPPTANNQSISTLENQARALTLTGSDIDGSSLVYTVTLPPIHGVLSGTAPNVTYTPTSGYVGTDSFAFTVNDGVYSSATASINISVIQVTKELNFNSGTGGTISGTTKQVINLNGDSAAVTASASAGYRFVNWSDFSGFFTTTANPLTVTNVTDDMTITANFSPDQTNGVCGTDNGKVLAALLPTNLCTAGNPSAVTGNGGNATPWSWSCQGSYGGTSSTCSAAIKQYNVNFTTQPNGSIDNAATQQINHGASTSPVTATTTATGYNFENWTGTVGFATTSSNPLTVTNVTSDLTITANFSSTSVDGVCGDDNNKVLAALAPTNLCSSGSPSAVTGNGTAADPWYWDCSGLYGSTQILNCSATKKQYDVSFTTPPNGSVIVGSTQTLDYLASTSPVRAEPNYGYHFVNWTGTDGFVTTTTNPLTVSNVTTNMSITANFANSTPTANNQSVTTPESQALSINLIGSDTELSSLTYTIVVNPTHGVLTGPTPNLTYTPTEKYFGSDSFTFTTSDGVNTSIAATVHITVTQVTQTVSFTAGANGTISGISPQTVNLNGTASQVTANPYSGYHFVNWTDSSGVVVSTTNPLVLNNVKTNMSITANFDSSKYSTTVSIPGGNGIVSCTPERADYGTSISCTVTPNEGYQLASLIDNGVAVLSTPGATSHTINSINANHALAATFSPKSYIVTINTGANGSSTPGVSQTIIRGNTLSIVLFPDSGHHIVTPLNSTCGGTLNGTVYTTAAITSGCIVTTEFMPNQYTVSATSTTGGNITPASSQVLHGFTSTFSITPDPGYYTGSVNGCGGTFSGPSYTTGSLLGGCSISASFTAYTLNDALQALRYAVKIATPKPEEYLWLDVAPLEADKPKGNDIIDIMDALVLLKQSIGSYTAW